MIGRNAPCIEAACESHHMKNRSDFFTRGLDRNSPSAPVGQMPTLVAFAAMQHFSSPSE
jgi:hypothetical protein